MNYSWLLLFFVTISGLVHSESESTLCATIHKAISHDTHYNLIDRLFNGQPDLFFSYAITNCTELNGSTIFHTWAYYNRRSEIPLAAFKHPMVFAPDMDGKTPLMTAVAQKNYRVVNGYLDHTDASYINLPDRVGRTAHHYAGINGDYDLLITLTKKGGGIWRLDAYGNFPGRLEHAKQRPHDVASLRDNFTDSEWDDESDLYDTDADDVVLSPARGEDDQSEAGSTKTCTNLSNYKPVWVLVRGGQPRLPRTSFLQKLLNFLALLQAPDFDFRSRPFDDHSMFGWNADGGGTLFENK